MFLDGIDVSVIFLDRSLNVWFINKACQESLGYSADDLLGMPFFRILGHGDVRRITLKLQECLERSNIKSEFELDLLRKDGSGANYQVTAFSGKLADGGTYAMLHLKNLTEISRDREFAVTAATLYDAIAEQASECFYMHDFSGRFVRVNQQACDALGYTRQELLSMNVTDIEQDFDLKAAQAEWLKIQPGIRFTLRGRQRRKDGTTFPVVISFGSVVLNGEKFYLGLARDMTEVEQTEEKYRAMVEGAPDPIFIQSEGRFAYLNPAACDFFGIGAPEELLGTPVLDRVGPEFRDMARERIRRLNEAHASVKEIVEQKFIRRDGGVVWAQTKGEPIVYEGKKSALVFARNTTERRAAEEALRKTEKKYETLFNKANIPILLIRFPELSIIDVNDAWTQTLGFTREEVVGKRTDALGITPFTESTIAMTAELERSGSVIGVEMKIYTKAGEERTVLSNINILDYEDERYALITNLDITERKKAEQQLFELGEKFQKSFDYSAIGMHLASLDGEFLVVNKKMCEIFACDKEDLEGTHFSAVTYPDDIDLSRAYVSRLRTGLAKSVSFEKRYVRKNGEVFWSHVVSTLLSDASGSPLHFITQIQDITERRRMEEELRAREEFSRAVMDNLPIGISVNSVQPPLVFEYMNDNFATFYRTTREALQRPDAFFEAVYEDASFRETIRGRVLEDMAGGDPSRMRWENVPITRAGAETRYISAYNTLVPGRDMHISIVTDETERVLALQALEKNAARFLKLHEFDQAIIRGLETPGKIGEAALRYIFELIGPGWAGIGITGAEGAEIGLVTADSNDTEFRHQTPALAGGEAALLGLLERGTVYMYGDIPNVDLRVLLRRLFEEVGDDALFRPLYSAAGPNGILCVATPAAGAFSGTDREIVQEIGLLSALAIERQALKLQNERYATALEQMIGERTAQLEEAVKELEAFTYSVSHDLRAPLRSLNGFVRILLEDYGEKLDEEGRRVCGIIGGGAQQMGRLIDDLLALSRVGRSSMALMPVDMKTMVWGLYYELTTEAQRKHIKLSVGRLPDAVADPTLIRLVWMNLMDNAVKFTSKKQEARIRVQGKRVGDEIVYSVTDNGAGFDMKYMNKLFGVFQRLHSVNEFDGTGVGLAIVQRIVLRHGGRVWAQGEEDRGATFYFSLKKEADTDVTGDH